MAKSFYKGKGVLPVALLALLFSVAGAGTVEAAFSYSNYLQNGVLVLPHAGKVNTGSKIYELSDLHVATDNFLYLDAPIRTYVQADLQVGKNLRIARQDGTYTGSEIYDNDDLNIVTDNTLYLQAPLSVNVSNDMTVSGNLTVSGTLNATVNLPDSSITMAKLTGVLPVSKGGTGSATQNFVDLTTGQTIAGTKTFSSSIVGNLTGNVTGNVTGNLTGNVTGNVTGDVTGDLTGNADTATTASGVSAGAVGTAGLAANAVTAVKLQNAAADLGASDVTVNLSNSNGAFVTNVTIDGNFTARSLFLSGVANLGRQTMTIVDNGGGTAATGSLTATSSYVEIDCQDADGCDVAIAEGSAVEGDTLFIVNTSANVVNFADAAGVTELAGAFNAGTLDTISMIYMGATGYVELARSNN